jgi:transcriptional regulator with XRE-family HTH domain
MKDNITPEKLRSLRHELGYSQQKMAEVLGYQSRSMVCHLENGNREITPRLNIIIGLLKDKHEGETK